MRNLILFFLVVLFFLPSAAVAKDKFFFNKESTIKELAVKNKIKTSKLIHELDDELGFSSVKPEATVREIGLSKAQFKKLYLHLHEDLTSIIVMAMFLWVIISFIIVMLLKQKKLTAKIRIIVFLFVIPFFGIFLHAKPGAMEAIVKVFKATAGKESWHLKILFFSFFSLFCIAASNLFCSIGCQIGVVQDLIFQLFRLKKIKYRKIPFWISNGIRIIIFIIFLLFMYNILTGLKSASLYHNVNIFKIYILNLSIVGSVTFALVVLLSGVIYRPFCSLICPFGLWSWVLSHLSVLRIKIEKDDCTKCLKCIRVCPNNAMKNIYENKFIKADCYVCGECINQCPANCIRLKL